MIQLALVSALLLPKLTKGQEISEEFSLVFSIKNHSLPQRSGQIKKINAHSV